MPRFVMTLPIAAALCLGLASGSFANTDDQDWMSFEQIFGGTSPPKSTADGAKYSTAAVKTECENRMNRGTTFTYRATGDNRQNAETAAQNCGMMGKTADVKGLRRTATCCTTTANNYITAPADYGRGGPTPSGGALPRDGVGFLGHGGTVAGGEGPPDGGADW